MSALPDFTGPGFFAGEAPDGLTTIAGTPTSASVRVYWRDPTDPQAPDALVASTQSAADGTWQIAGLNPALRYVVRAQKSQFDDVTVVGAMPARSDVIAYVDQLVPREDEFGDVDGLTGYVLLDSGLPPFTCEVIQPLPYGLTARVEGRKLLIEGVSTDNGLWESVVRVTASNGVWVDVPVHAVIGLRAPDIAVRYAAAGDWTITLQLAGGSEFADGLRVYRSTEPLDLEALPDYVAELDADADQWVDADVEPGQTYYYAVDAYVGGAVAMSQVVKREAMWTPDDLPQVPQIWLDWESPITLSSGAVSAWGNRGSIGGSFAQGTASYRPTIMDAEINGKRVLRFNDGCLENSTTDYKNVMRNTGYGSAFAVYRRINSGTSYVAQPILAFGTGSGSGNAGRFVAYAGTGEGNNNKAGLGVRRLDSDTIYSNYGAVDTGTDWAIGTFVADYSSGVNSVRVNGGVASSNIVMSPGLTSNTGSLNPVRVGQESNAANHRLRGDIAIVIVNSGVPWSMSDIEKLEGWSAHQLGLTDQLPAGHPYKSVAP